MEQDIKFLTAGLQMGVREVFNELYSSYTHYHKAQRQGEDKYTVWTVTVTLSLGSNLIELEYIFLRWKYYGYVKFLLLNEKHQLVDIQGDKQWKQLTVDF